jgi:hypothetical protein
LSGALGSTPLEHRLDSMDTWRCSMCVRSFKGKHQNSIGEDHSFLLVSKSFCGRLGVKKLLWKAWRPIDFSSCVPKESLEKALIGHLVHFGSR